MKIFYFIFVFLILFLSCGKDKSDDITISKKENATKQNYVSDNTETINPEDKSPQDKISENTEKESIEIITTDEVNDYIDKKVVVRGYVADVAIRPKVNYLNFDKKFPDHTFTVVIFPSDASKFDDLNEFKNKNVEVSGKIKLYKGKPQIIVNSPAQIKIIK